jgi:DNA-binding transcriptional ArsR family regulator
MKPLFHPAVEDVTVEGILHALADPVRVAIFAEVVNADCMQNCSQFLRVSERAIPKSTLSQHFKALREAGLIRGERCGVEMRNMSRCAEIDQRFPGLVGSIVGSYQRQVAGKAKRGKSAARKAPERAATA